MKSRTGQMLGNANWLTHNLSSFLSLNKNISNNGTIIDEVDLKKLQEEQHCQQLIMDTWLHYWIVWGTFHTMTRFPLIGIDTLCGWWIPFYEEMKLVLLTWMALNCQDNKGGTEWIYQWIIKPGYYYFGRNIEYKSYNNETFSSPSPSPVDDELEEYICGLREWIVSAAISLALKLYDFNPITIKDAKGDYNHDHDQNAFFDSFLDLTCSSSSSDIDGGSE